MKRSILATFSLMAILASSSATAVTVYDATNWSTSDTQWWWGQGTSQVHANIVNLAGTARNLDSVTLGHFWYSTTGTYNITASIYAVPPTINDNDLLGTPLWTSTVTKNYTGYGGVYQDSISFTGNGLHLPDQVVLAFSFATEDGTGAIPFFQYGPKQPAVGSLVTGVYYSGFTDNGGGSFAEGWYNMPETDTFYPYAIGKIDAAVPDPSAIVTLGMGLSGLLFMRRRARK